MVEVNEKLLKSKAFVESFNRILKEGDPMTLTATSIRKELEDLFKLERNSLKEQPWKKEINSMIDEYTATLGDEEELQGGSDKSTYTDAEEGEEQQGDDMEEDNEDQQGENDDSDDEFEETPTKQKRKRSDHSTKKRILDSSDEESQLDNRNSKDNDESESDTSTAPPPPPSKKKQRQSKEQPTKKQQPSTKEKESIHRTKTHIIDSSDKDSQPDNSNSKDKDESESDTSATAPKKKQRQSQEQRAKKAKKPAHRTAKHIIDSSDEDLQPENSNSEDQDRSESDTSVAAPKKKQRQSKEQHAKKRPGVKTKATSPDEETIKRLKAYIRKCGIPVIRQKELADCDTLKSQIHKLKSMLNSLGVQGRPTNEKCEKIKAERELRAEIDSLDTENILESSSRGPSLRSRAVSSRKKRHIVEEDDSDEEDAPKPLDVSFLGDQSDDSD